MSNALLAKRSSLGTPNGTGELVDSILGRLDCAINSCHMGITAEEIVTRYGVSREDQDAFAVESQQRAVRAIKDGRFATEIVPVDVPQKKGDPRRVDTDEYPRADTSIERLRGLRPAFKKDGSVTAGNSSGINDGAAALVVSTDTKARELGIKPLARVVAYATAGVDPKIMGMGPVPAVRRALDRAGLTPKDIDHFELNEAFAAQASLLSANLAWSEAGNPFGGAIALGIPLVERRADPHDIDPCARRARRGRGGGALCVGGGMGVAMVVETR